jgi:FlgD Ig-like domain
VLNPRDRGSASVLGAALFVALFVASLAVTGVVINAKTPDLVLEARGLPLAFSPNGDGERELARISFFVRESESHARVEIVDANGETVRTLDPDVELIEDREVTYRWNGRTDLGGAAPFGRYHLRVVLPSHDRDVVFPRRIELRL